MKVTAPANYLLKMIQYLKYILRPLPGSGCDCMWKCNNRCSDTSNRDSRYSLKMIQNLKFILRPLLGSGCDCMWKCNNRCSDTSNHDSQYSFKEDTKSQMYTEAVTGFRLRLHVEMQQQVF